MHVLIGNHDYKFALRLIRIIKQSKDFNYKLELNKVDEEGNTALHVLMRNFNKDPENSCKIGKFLIKRGIDIRI